MCVRVLSLIAYRKPVIQKKTSGSTEAIDFSWSKIKQLLYIYVKKRELIFDKSKVFNSPTKFYILRNIRRGLIVLTRIVKVSTRAKKMRGRRVQDIQ